MPSPDPNADIALATSLFDALSRATRRGTGVVRESYGPGEQAAHDIMRAAAGKIGLEVAVDAIGNLMMTLPGRDRSVPRILIGSHLDSVRGRQFRRRRGVVAGLSAVSALRQAGIVPGATSSLWAFAPKSPRGSMSPISAARGLRAA